MTHDPVLIVGEAVEENPAPLVAVEDVKARLHITSTGQDKQIAETINAAAGFIEGCIGWPLHATNCEIRLAALPRYRELTFSHGSMDIDGLSVAYDGGGESSSTLPATHYRAIVEGQYRQRLRIAFDRAARAMLPVGHDGNRPIAIRLVIGFSADNLPTPIAQAIHLLTAAWHDNPTAIVIGATPHEMPHGVRALISPFMRVPI